MMTKISLIIQLKRVDKREWRGVCEGVETVIFAPNFEEACNRLELHFIRLMKKRHKNFRFDFLEIDI